MYYSRIGNHDLIQSLTVVIMDSERGRGLGRGRLVGVGLASAGTILRCTLVILSSWSGLPAKASF